MSGRDPTITVVTTPLLRILQSTVREQPINCSATDSGTKIGSSTATAVAGCRVSVIE